MTREQADELFRRSCTEASGYLELAIMTKNLGGDTTAMREACIRALKQFADNDEAVDAMYDAMYDAMEEHYD